MRRAVATWAGLLSSTVLLTGALAGCTGDEPDDPATPTSGAGAETSAPASPTAEPSPDVTKPERPAAMEKHDADGAAAAAVYFMELYPYIMKTGDTDEFKKMSGESCDFCEASLQQANEIARKGYLFDGGETTARTLQSYQQDAATSIWPVDIESTTAATTITDESGEVVFEAGQEVTESRFEVARGRGNDWVVVGVADVPEDQ